MAIVCLETGLKFRRGIANVTGTVGRGRWGGDTGVRFCCKSSNVGEAKFLTFFAGTFLVASTFSFVFCTAVVDHGGAFYNLGRVGKERCEESFRNGVE